MIIRDIQQEDIIYLNELNIEKVTNPSEQRFVIADDENQCMGTVGLRYIDNELMQAELYIAVRTIAESKGYAWHGMTAILDKAFDELSLEKIYWCVEESNKRAIRFFKKHGFNSLDEDVPKDVVERHIDEGSLIWFAVLKGDDYKNEALSRGTVAGCKIIRINTVPTIEAGELSFFESGKDIGFDIKRVYYISKVPEGVRRGFHAHKELKQVLFCPYGQIQLVLENGSVREEITLSDPSIGVVIEQPTWREMLWLQKDSVLVVAASEQYDPEDYIRSYNEFIEYIR